MKHLITFGSIAIIAFFLTSCKKDSADSNATIIGKWNIVTDSTYFKGGCCYENKVYYIGKPGDYFDFRNDGKFYSKEGTTLDTATYQLTSNSTILIFGKILPTLRIADLTAHHSNLKTLDYITFGMSGWRRLSLSR